MALGRIFIAACVAVAVAASADPACSGTAGPCSAEGQQSVADTHTVVVEGRNKSTSKYINRELSWLAFNERVIAEAESTRHPLLERGERPLVVKRLSHLCGQLRAIESEQNARAIFNTCFAPCSTLSFHLYE